VTKTILARKRTMAKQPKKLQAAVAPAQAAAALHLPADLMMAAYRDMMRAVRSWVRLTHPDDLPRDDIDRDNDLYHETVTMLSVTAWSQAGGGHDLIHFHLEPGDDQRHADFSSLMRDTPEHCVFCHGDRLAGGGRP